MTYAVILAGGWGERLWPMSSRSRPKQLVSLTGGPTLVARTLDRIEPLVELESTFVLTSLEMRERIVTELDRIPQERIIGEPVGRNTAPAIALAARLLLAEDPDAVMIVLPADHVIADDEAFRGIVELAVTAAREARGLVTLGIRPTRPETEYGYIRALRPSGVDGVLLVDRFEEKPDRARAARFLSEGDYYWNSGIFVWRADRFLSEIAAHLPEVARGLASVSAPPGGGDFASQLAGFYDVVPSVSVDYGVMEKADGVLVVPAAFGWDDVGAWSALERVWPRDERGNTVAGETVLIDARDCVVYSEDGTVAVLGVEGMVVARTAEATLVCPKDRAAEVRRVVEELKLRDRDGGGRGRS